MLDIIEIIQELLIKVPPTSEEIKRLRAISYSFPTEEEIEEQIIHRVNLSSDDYARMENEFEREPQINLANFVEHDEDIRIAVDRQATSSEGKLIDMHSSESVFEYRGK